MLQISINVLKLRLLYTIIYHYYITIIFLLYINKFHIMKLSFDEKKFY